MPILTRRLREFLESPESFSPSYRRYLRHVLKSRISEAMKELEYIGEKAPELLKGIGPNRLLTGRSWVRVPPGPHLFASIRSTTTTELIRCRKIGALQASSEEMGRLRGIFRVKFY
jgi:hypothetical protein